MLLMAFIPGGEALQKLTPLLRGGGSFLQFFGCNFETGSQDAQAAQRPGEGGGVILNGDLIHVDQDMIPVGAVNCLLRPSAS